MKIGFAKSDGGRAAAGIQDTRDCTVRAYSIFFDIPYAEAHERFKRAGRKNGQGFPVISFRPIINGAGGVEHRTKPITLNQLIKEYPKGKIYCVKRGHAFTVIDGVIHDTFEVGKKSRVLHYWTLPEMSAPAPKKEKKQKLYYPTVIRNIIAKNTTISKHCIAKMISDQWNVSVASAYYHVRKYYSK